MMVMCAGITSGVSMRLVCMVGIMFVFSMRVWCHRCTVNRVLMGMMFMVVIMSVTARVVVLFLVVMVEAVVMNTRSVKGNVSQSAMLVRNKTLEPFLILFGKGQVCVL